MIACNIRRYQVEFLETKYGVYGGNEQGVFKGSKPMETRSIDSRNLKKFGQKLVQLAMMAITIVNLNHSLTSQKVKVPTVNMPSNLPPIENMIRESF